MRPPACSSARAAAEHCGPAAHCCCWWCYWWWCRSPAPAWKDSQAYINGALAGFNASFLSSFADAVVQDLQYLEANGMHVVQFGLQNEPPVGPEGCIYR